MTLPPDYLYTKEHEWLRKEADGTATIGITDFAQSELGDLVFVDLPQIGGSLVTGKSFCVVESTKAASDVFAPVDAAVTGVNSELSTHPELVNQSPYEKGWLCKIEGIPAEAIGSLMNAAQYENFLKGK